MEDRTKANTSFPSKCSFKRQTLLSQDSSCGINASELLKWVHFDEPLKEIHQ